MPFDFATAAQKRGLANYHAGLAAEGSVELKYEASGAVLLERRWRGAAGEVDLILRDGDELVFVEVKKSKCFTRAAESLSQRQLARISLAAEEFLGTKSLGSLTPMRIDVALTNATGEVDILRNVTGF